MKIVIQVKSNYGALTAYPVCEKAKLFAAIAGTKTLTTQALQQIKRLGYEIVQQTEEFKI